jgi:hypothetical protein
MAATPTQFAQGDASLTVAAAATTLGAAITTAGIYVCRLDLTNLAAGDTYELYVYSQVQTTGQGGAEALNDYFTFGPVVPLKKVVETVPYIGLNSLTFKLGQPAGTSHTVPWEVVAL